jgi:hypothetical protein
MAQNSDLYNWDSRLYTTRIGKLLYITLNIADYNGWSNAIKLSVFGMNNEKYLLISASFWPCGSMPNRAVEWGGPYGNFFATADGENTGIYYSVPDDTLNCFKVVYVLGSSGSTGMTINLIIRIL